MSSKLATLLLVLQRDYPSQVCSIARALEVVGERWTLLILRDAVLGLTRFEDFQESLGVASNTLANRLERIADIIGPFMDDADRCLTLGLALRLRRSPRG